MDLDLELINVATAEPEIGDPPDWLTPEKPAFIGAVGRNQTCQAIVGRFAYFENGIVLDWENAIADGVISQPRFDATERSIQEIVQKIQEVTFRNIAWALVESGDLNYVEVEQPQPAEYVPIPEDLHPDVAGALPFPRLYRHQAESFEALRCGKGLGLFTPTASGKTGCFLPGIFDALLRDPTKTALFVYPIKALANDQSAKMAEINNRLPTPVPIALITGDIPSARRPALLDTCRILCMSPDVLHWMLNNVTKGEAWEGLRRFFLNLKFIVIDEGHTYRGVFGGNMINLCRRIRGAVNTVSMMRGNVDVLALEDALPPLPADEREYLSALPTTMVAERKVQWIVASATVGNPQKLACKLAGWDKCPGRLHSVEKSTAGSKGRVFLALKPQKSLNATVVSAAISAIAANLSGIVFTNSRDRTKSLVSQIKEMSAKQGRRDIGQQVMGYYGSLKTEDRAEIIRALSTKDKSCVISTSALEAGIDLPDLRFVILAGYGGSIMSTRQRMGRCGRTAPGLVIFVPSANDYLDSYYSKQPELLLHGAAEFAESNPDYPITVGRHLSCAGREGYLPASHVSETFGWIGSAVLEKMVTRGALAVDQGMVSSKETNPHGEVNMRGTGGFTVSVKDAATGDEIEQMDDALAISEVYPGAIYKASSLGSDDGLDWFVSEELDMKKRVARLKKIDQPEYSTQALGSLNVTPLKGLMEPKILEDVTGRIRISLDWGRVVRTTFGYNEVEEVTTHRCGRSNCGLHNKDQSTERDTCASCRMKMKAHKKKTVVNMETFEAPYHSGFDAPVLSVEFDMDMCSEIIRQVEVAKAKALDIFNGDLNVALADGADPLWDADPVFLGLHSFAHGMKFATPLVTLFSRYDLNAMVEQPKKARVDEPETPLYDSNGWSAFKVRLYDTSSGGSGAVQSIFEEMVTFCERSLDLSHSCACNFGCPSCLIDPTCPQGNKGLNKIVGMSLTDLVSKNLK
jgi:DEAD/DEAH box helicase domain-containing protein